MLAALAAAATPLAFTVPAAAANNSSPPPGTSNATAQGVRIDLAGSKLLAISDPPLSVHSDGTATDTDTTSPPVSGSLPAGGLQAGAVAETGKARKNGSSYACSGVVAPGGTLQIGKHGENCSVKGSGTGGVTINLTNTLKTNGLLGGLLKNVAQVKLTADAVTAHAVDNGTTSVGGAKVANLHLKVSLLGGDVIDLPIDVSSNQHNENVLTLVVNALNGYTGGLLGGILTGPLTDALANALQGLVSIKSNVQTSSGSADLSVIALQVKVLKGDLARINLAHVTVGPNTPAEMCKAPFEDVPSSSPFCRAISYAKDKGITVGVTPKLYKPTNPESRAQIIAFVYRKAHDGKMAPDCTAKPFSDVYLSDPFCGAIAWGKKHDIALGFKGGKFKPADPESRAQMAGFLYRANHDGANSGACSGDAPYQDVSKSSVFCGDITWFKDQDITVGYKNGDFEPTRNVSRQTMAAYLYRLVHPNWLNGFEGGSSE
jgi:hypothetical protein